jgi:ABC-type transport system involved in cytochrome c biogenesis permease subunit
MWKRFFIFSFFIVTLVNAHFPVAHQGRFIPVDVYTKLWLYDLYQTREIRSSEKQDFHNLSGADIVWEAHFNQTQEWKNTPLIFIGSAELKTLLNLPLKKSRFSFHTLKNALFENEEINLKLMERLIISAYQDVVRMRSYPPGREAIELNSLSPGLWVQYLNGQLQILAAPKQPPWHFLSPNLKIDYTSSVKPLPEALELLGKMQRLESAAVQLSTNLSIPERLKLAGSDFKALPYLAKPGEWVSLRILDDDIPNFTPYSNDIFEQIRTAYRHRDRESLSKFLSFGYQSIAGQPYLKAEGKSLRYPSHLQLKAESLLYQYPWLILCAIIYALAILAFCLSMPRTSLIFILSAWVVHTLLLAVRSYVLQRPPVSNMFETVIYVPWVAMTGGLILRIFSKENWLLFAAALTNVLLLILLEITQMNGGLENVQAVLDSQYWLIVHVLMVVGSYGMFALAGILGHVYLFMWYRKSPRLSSIGASILQSLYLGTALLIPGTILGGVWAAESWGRFWDWDPKESWAFISSCIYLIWIHAYRFGHIRYFGLAIGSITGLMAISFTWYGVNYVLGTGLHSYGFGNGGEIYYYLYLAGESAFLLTAWKLYANDQNSRGQAGA